MNKKKEKYIRNQVFQQKSFFKNDFLSVFVDVMVKLETSAFPFS